MEHILLPSEDPCEVYASIDERNQIVGIQRKTLLPSTDGWIKIDEGQSDRYYHCQNNYLPRSLVNNCGIYRYYTSLLQDNKEAEVVYLIDEVEYGIYERSDEDMKAMYVEPDIPPTNEELRIIELE